jgi:hypothetical protein
MLGIVVVFAIIAAFGQVQRIRRAETVRATITWAPNKSPTPSPPPAISR